MTTDNKTFDAAAAQSTHDEFLKKFQTERHDIREVQKDESILTENKRRFVLFPIKYHEVYDAYKKREALFWPAEEMDFTKDVQEWKAGDAVNDDMKFYVTRLLALFASNYMDQEHLTEHLSAEVQIPEAKCMYGFQIMVDNVHQEVYALAIDNLIKDEATRASMFKDIENNDVVKEKIAYARRWFNASDSLFGEKLIAFAATLTIFSAGAYASLFALKDQNVLSGLTSANEIMFKDRAIHANFSCLMYAHLKHQLPNEVVTKIITDAVDIEKKNIVGDANLPVSKLDIKSEQMSQLLEYLADLLLVGFGVEKHYKTQNPFPYMEGVFLAGGDNSFQKKVADYQKAGDMAKAEKQVKDDTKGFSFNEDF